MLIIVIMGTALILLLLVAFYLIMNKEQQPVNQRMEKYARGASVVRATNLSSEPQPLGMEMVRYLSQFFSALPSAKRLDKVMMRAELTVSGSEFMVLAAGAILIVFLVVIIVSKGAIFVSLESTAVVALAIWVIVRIRISRRIGKFTSQIGDALSLMSNSLRSGFSFLQAADVVATEMQPPISQEFAQIVKETSLGLPLEDALENMLNRIGSMDLELFVTAVVTQRQIGGNLAHIMDGIAQNLKDRINIEQEVKANSAQGRLAGLVVGGLPILVGMIIYTTSPDYLAVFFQPEGRMLLIVAIVLELLGIIVIRKIVSIEY